MRQRGAGLLALLVAILLVPLPSTAEEVEFTFDGGGWGHGVGMSQFGAYGMALEDATVTAEDILSHYYTGSEIGEISTETVEPFLLEEAMPLWVGIFQDDVTVTFQVVGGEATLCFGGEDEPDCSLTAAADDLWRYEFLYDGCQFSKKIDGFWTAQPGTKTTACGASATPSDSETTIVLTALSTPLQLKAGILRIREDVATPSDSDLGLHAVWQTALEDYLRGIAEMPDSWGDVAPSALEAQAIAARTYAVNRVGERGSESSFSVTRKGLCWCNIFDDTRDQVFTGLTGELGHPNAAAAAAETANRVVLFGGSTIQAYYFSSSFGRTENVEDVFTQTLPYLRSVDDHWSSTAPGNPFDKWDPPPGFSAGELATRLGWMRVDEVVLESPAPGTRVRIEGLDVGGNPITTVFRGEDLRTPLGLLSPQITAINGPFADIANSPHEANIIVIWQEGVTQGCAAGLFCPNAPVTRGQMASFLARSLELPAPTNDFFDDDDGSTHEDNINRVAEAGIATGFADGTYRPSDPVRRDHMATFLARSLGLEPVPGSVFVDVFGFHEGNINAIALAGVTEGCDDEGPSYCPGQLVTRGQMASFLARAFFIP